MGEVILQILSSLCLTSILFYHFSKFGGYEIKYDECVFVIRIMNLDCNIYKYVHIFVHHFI